MIQAVLLLSFLAQDDQKVVDALARFKAAYRGPSAAARAAAVTELSLLPHEKTFSRLAPLLMGEVREVRIAAIAGLGGFAAQKRVVTPALLNTLASTAKEPEVSAAVLAALGKLKDQTALPAVFARFRKEHITVAKAAVACAGAIGTRDSIQSLHQLSQDLQKWSKAGSGGGYYDGSGVGEAAAQTARVEALKAEVVKAFQAISKEEWTTLKEWEVWYRRNKDNPKFRK